MVTAFEVFEHLVNPRIDAEDMFSLSDTILFTTELVPEITQEPDYDAALNAAK